jgi:hypothetical protein
VAVLPTYDAVTCTGGILVHGVRSPYRVAALPSSDGVLSSRSSRDGMRYSMYMDRDNRITKSGRGNNCQHSTAEWLGSDGGMTFSRCPTCRCVVVTQGRTILAVPFVPTDDSLVAQTAA